ncbi:hypothetical protein Sros01_82940 [Streptomyces roseochromogenus]|nr:hypothetical protein Sros01_82940 [Streptomyces roseochromogenus]
MSHLDRLGDVLVPGLERFMLVADGQVVVPGRRGMAAAAMAEPTWRPLVLADAPRMAELLAVCEAADGDVAGGIADDVREALGADAVEVSFHPLSERTELLLWEPRPGTERAPTARARRRQIDADRGRGARCVGCAHLRYSARPPADLTAVLRSPTVLAAADPDPLKAALEAVFQAVSMCGEHYPKLLEEIRAVCADQVTE